MLQPPPRPRAQLSHLVGPGPATAPEVPELSLGVCNTGDGLCAVELELEIAPAGGAALARASWSGLLAPAARRELAARVDWARRELVLAGRAFAFEGRGTAEACVARVRLRAAPDAAQVLEVGLRAPAGAGAR